MQSGVQAHRYNSQRYSIGGDGSSDHGQLLKRCEQKASLIFEVEKSVGWSKLWDVTLDVLSMRDERSAASEYRMMSHHGRGNRPCPLCDIAALEAPAWEHVISD